MNGKSEDILKNKIKELKKLFPEAIVKEILKLKPKKVICLDSLFEKNDKLKTNTALQMKDAEVEFKTI